MAEEAAQPAPLQAAVSASELTQAEPQDELQWEEPAAQREPVDSAQAATVEEGDAEEAKEKAEEKQREEATPRHSLFSNDAPSSLFDRDDESDD